MSDPKRNKANMPEEPDLTEADWGQESVFDLEPEESASEPAKEAVKHPVEEASAAGVGEEPTGVIHWNGPSRGQWPQVLRTPGQENQAAQPVDEPTRPLTGEHPVVSQTGERPAVKEPEPQPAKRRKRKPVPPTDAEEERQYHPIRFSRHGRIGCLGGMMYATFIICLSIILACFLWMAASDVLALNKDDYTVEIVLPDAAFYDKEVDVKDDEGNVTGTKTVQAADINMVSGILRDYGLINYKWLFKLYSSFSDADLQIDPGTYELSTSYDYRALVKKMQVGSDSQLQTLVMLPEGYTMDQIFIKLEENGVCSREDLYEAAASAEYSYAFLEGVGTGDAGRLEGFLFPDTYYFYQGMQASSAINKFLSTLHYKITAEMWDQAASMGLTFREVMTVASMIEKEAANDEERAKIASVIYNRLNKGMLLQIDATVNYAYALAGEPDVELSVEKIQAMDSPYNTYLYTGLPAGPICNPGLASIQAALDPAATDYLYYALDTATMTHKFFIFQDEHAAFVATQDYSGTTE